MRYYGRSYRIAEITGISAEKQALLDNLYQTIVDVRTEYLKINEGIEYLHDDIDDFYVNHGNTSAINKLYKAGDLLSMARQYHSISNYICEMNSYLHPMADQVLSEDISTAFLKQNYMLISNTIQYNCNLAEKTLIERTEEVLQKAQDLYNEVLEDYYKDISK